jgi:hypothetical protein
MTQDEIKALIEDLRLNHEFCPKEVILQAADELERMQVRIPRPPKREWAMQQMVAENQRLGLYADDPPTCQDNRQVGWVGLTDSEIAELHHKWAQGNLWDGWNYERAIEDRLREKNNG